MTYKILYLPIVRAQDIPKIPKSYQTRIKLAVERKLMSDPLIFGKPLRGCLVPGWSLRVAEYRLIYAVNKTEVLVVAIMHRSTVYKKILNADNNSVLKGN